MRPQTRHFVKLTAVFDAFSNFFHDMKDLMRHTGKLAWFGPKEDLAVIHNRNLYILGNTANDTNRYELSTAVKFLEYLLKPERIEATRAVILFHCNPGRLVIRQLPHITNSLKIST